MSRRLSVVTEQQIWKCVCVSSIKRPYSPLKGTFSVSRGALAASWQRSLFSCSWADLQARFSLNPSISFETENVYRKLIFDELQLVMAILLKGHRQKALALNTFGSVLHFNKASIQQNTSLASFEIVFSVTKESRCKVSFNRKSRNDLVF